MLDLEKSADQCNILRNNSFSSKLAIIFSPISFQNKINKYSPRPNFSVTFTENFFILSNSQSLTVNLGA